VCFNGHTSSESLTDRSVSNQAGLGENSILRAFPFETYSKPWHNS
jgi:hypothetical protein